MLEEDDPRMFVVERDGVLYFNGRTAEERLACLDQPRTGTTSTGDGREAAGTEIKGSRQGTWRYSIKGELRFVVQFKDGRPIDPPAGWVDDEWPRSDSYRRERELLELVLREYRRPEDIERIYSMITALGHNSVPVVVAIRQALGLTLNEAKMALDDACTRDKRKHGRWY